MAAKKKNTRQAWTDKDEDKLRYLAGKGATYAAIAQALGRKETSIKSKMGQLGIGNGTRKTAPKNKKKATTAKGRNARRFPSKASPVQTGVRVPPAELCVTINGKVVPIAKLEQAIANIRQARADLEDLVG